MFDEGRAPVCEKFRNPFFTRILAKGQGIGRGLEAAFEGDVVAEVEAHVTLGTLPMRILSEHRGAEAPEARGLRGAGLPVQRFGRHVDGLRRSSGTRTPRSPLLRNGA
jgi:hypothetical protein